VSLRVLIAGEEAAGAHILRAVAGSAHSVAAVLTGPTPAASPNPVARVAQRLEIPVLPAASVRKRELARRMRAWGVDLLLNAHSLHLATPEVLAAPRVGSFNLHPGPLPEYAGLNTVAWAIYNGEAEHGVTVHWMAPRIDAGPIVLEERFPIGPGDTSLTVSSECTRRGVRLLLAVLDLATEGPYSIPARPQDLSRRTYYSGRSKPAGGRVSWDRPAEEVERLSRAFDYGPFPCPWGRLVAQVGGVSVEVAGIARTGAPSGAPPGTARATGEGRVEVACRDEWVRLGKVFADGSLIEAEALLGASGRGIEAEAAPNPSQGVQT
jgi:UDP-4-amino-4-deoxy-L-arabinose formyltransferase/UDP-glucuronic acid dehydrogenase (UDP-4-keto-hexauronic acid decarboxylating)